MKIRSILLLPAAMLLCASALLGQATHTWVSATGSDSNNGTYAHPYADFATAVANTAVGGIVSVEGPGDYGAVTITQSITIDGTGGGSITFTGEEGIYINATTTSSVILRNLVVNGVGQGVDAIYLAQGLNLVIDGCRLEGFTDIGVGVESTSAQNVVIRNTVIQGGQLGVRTFQSSGSVPYDHVTLQNVTIQGASNAAVFSRNGGLAIIDSMIAENNIGVQVDTSAVMTVERSMIYDNTTGVCAYTLSTIRLSNTDIMGNTTGLGSCGGTIASAGNNPVAGNPTTNPPNGTVTLQ
jgi:hypothetical protein